MRERTQVIIQGKPWKLVWRSSLRRALGRCDHDNLRIELMRGYPFERTVATLIHEVLHGLNRELEIGLSHREISLLESGLCGFLCASGVDLRPLVYAGGNTKAPGRAGGKRVRRA